MRSRMRRWGERRRGRRTRGGRGAFIYPVPIDVVVFYDVGDWLRVEDVEDS